MSAAELRAIAAALPRRHRAIADFLAHRLERWAGAIERGDAEALRTALAVCREEREMYPFERETYLAAGHEIRLELEQLAPEEAVA